MVSHEEVIELVAAVIPDERLVNIAKSLCGERDALVEACEEIAGWDLTHPEALTVDTAIKIIVTTIEGLG